MGLEGIVSKRADSRYVAGRNDSWLKTTCRHRDTFAVVGWAEKAKKFDGIYLGREEEGRLIYAGKLERGFTEDDKKSIIKRLSALRVRQRPMIACAKPSPRRGGSSHFCSWTPNFAERRAKGCCVTRLSRASVRILCNTGIASRSQIFTKCEYRTGTLRRKSRPCPLQSRRGRGAQRYKQITFARARPGPRPSSYSNCVLTGGWE
jgi:hypothetical protein